MKPYCMFCGCEGTHSSQEDCHKAKVEVIARNDADRQEAIRVYKNTGRLTGFLNYCRW